VRTKYLSTASVVALNFYLSLRKLPYMVRDWSLIEIDTYLSPKIYLSLHLSWENLSTTLRAVQTALKPYLSCT
jgi:hypothetical protein